MERSERGWSTGERDEFGHPKISPQPVRKSYPTEEGERQLEELMADRPAENEPLEQLGGEQ